MEKRIDSHCHVFNKDILTYRIVLHLISTVVIAIYQHRKRKDRTSTDFLKLIAELRNVIQFIKAGWEENSIGVFNTMQNFQSIFTAGEFRQIAYDNPVKFLGIPGL